MRIITNYLLPSLAIGITGLFGLLLSIDSAPVPLAEPATKFHIIIPSYNNEKWCLGNIASIARQNYPQDLWYVTIIVDAATDQTYSVLNDYLTAHPELSNITLLRNPTRQGALANFYYAINATPDDYVCVCVDGDDRLAHANVLRILDRAYQSGEVWLTFGQFRNWPSERIGWVRPYPAQVIQNNSFRQCRRPELPSHLKTFKAWLFKLIDINDLQLDGHFLDVCSDTSFMFPMIEMAGERHCFIPEVLYIYNNANPLSDFNQKMAWQHQVDIMIRGNKKYARLAHSPVA